MEGNTCIIITSIFNPNSAVDEIQKISKKSGSLFVVAGDCKTPQTYQSYDCSYLSIEKQIDLFPELANVLPLNHYGRKNMGYLYAMKMGADRIVETDDDNIPRHDFLSRTSPRLSAEVVNSSGWVNAYHFYSQAHIWPRGFPIDKIQSFSSLPETEFKSVYAPIQQGLADENPDVDAIYRMTGTLPISFDVRGDIAFSEGAWCPFNSQNTTWFRDAFPLLYLPSCCSFRMTDIWRSFVAQRILWQTGSCLVFHKATVWQERNDHDLLKDFQDEIPGYLNNDRICKTLEDLKLLSGWENSAENLIICYDALIKLGVIDSAERNILKAWIHHMEDTLDQ